jgi:ArsR family transcriptional regulator, arsenate/arsenite/antimonite-responsive transcriptional repressor
MKHLAPGPEDVQLAAMFHALASPLRLAILRYVALHPGCICNDLVIRLERAQATISQHLAILRRAEILLAERDGHATCYSLDTARLAWLEARMSQLRAGSTTHEPAPKPDERA